MSLGEIGWFLAGVVVGGLIMGFASFRITWPY
jgi:hypothetical protein